VIDTEPYARAVVQALRAADILVTEYSTTGPETEPSIYIEFDRQQCWRVGYYTVVCLSWSSTGGWRYGPEDPEASETFLWAVRLGDTLLPTPAEMVGLVDRVVFHADWWTEPEFEYRAENADDDLAGQLDRAARGLGSDTGEQH
jgi:hypothetical protein